jgi:ubiquitin-protein ligase
MRRGEREPRGGAFRGGRGGAVRGGRGGFRSGRPMGQALLRTQLASTKTNSARRLQRDYAELKNSETPIVGVAAAPAEDTMFTWYANILGPAGTLYKGCVFHMKIDFPEDYPMSPPDITLLTPFPHSNVFGNKLCLDMLQKKTNDSWYDGWCPAYSVESVMLQLQSFLFDNSLTKAHLALETTTKEIQAAIEFSKAYKSPFCKHRGPGEPYPPFDHRENDKNAFVIIKDPKQLLAEEFICYYTRQKLPECSLGVGVSISRLPRTGEIRSVKPTIDLLSLRAFTKNKIRNALDNEKFTHWLPLYFGEKEKYITKEQVFNEETKEYETKTHEVDPYERYIKLLKHSISFLTKGQSKRELTPQMVIEVMPKLIITHLVELADEKKHVSIIAIRRLFNFLRLYRLLISL